MNFNFQSIPYHVVFRTGALAQLPEEVRKFGSRALVLSTRAVPLALERTARALQSTNAPQALIGLAKAAGAKTVLKDLGMQERDIDGVTEMALQDPYWNRESIIRSKVRLLISNAYWGCERVEISGSAL